MFKLIKEPRIDNINLKVGDIVKIGSQGYEISEFRESKGFQYNEIIIFGWEIEDKIKKPEDVFPLFCMKHLMKYIIDGTVTIVDNGKESNR